MSNVGTSSSVKRTLARQRKCQCLAYNDLAADRKHWPQGMALDTGEVVWTCKCGNWTTGFSRDQDLRQRQERRAAFEHRCPYKPPYKDRFDAHVRACCEKCNGSGYVPESALPAESPTLTGVPPINPSDPSCQIPVDHGDAREAGPSARRHLPRGTFARVCIEVEDEAVAHARKMASGEDDPHTLWLARDVVIADALRQIAGTFFADLPLEQRRELHIAFMASYFTERRKVVRRNA